MTIYGIEQVQENMQQTNRANVLGVWRDYSASNKLSSQPGVLLPSRVNCTELYTASKRMQL